MHTITVVRPVVSTVAVLGRFCLPKSDGSRVKTVTQGSPFAGGCCRTVGILRLKCDGTRADTRFHLSAKRTSPFKLVGASFQSTTGSRSVRISGGNTGYTTFWGSVKSTGYPFHSPVSPSVPLPCVTVYHHISTGLYKSMADRWPVWVKGCFSNVRHCSRLIFVNFVCITPLW
jgi:hypothetical protein